MIIKKNLDYSNILTLQRSSYQPATGPNTSLTVHVLRIFLHVCHLNSHPVNTVELTLSAGPWEMAQFCKTVTMGPKTPYNIPL